MANTPKQRATFAMHGHFDKAKKLLAESLDRMTKAESFGRRASMQVVPDAAAYAKVAITELLATLEHEQPEPMDRLDEIERKLGDALDFVKALRVS